jgi:hypothetical protein
MRSSSNDLVICAEIVPDPVGISGGVENIKIDTSRSELEFTLGKACRIFTFVTVLSFPSASRPFVLPATLPGNIASDYREASKLLGVSAAASDAFSRRCLQTILKKQGYVKSKLVHQIDDVLKETDPAKVVPHYITTRLDAVRHFGNLSAHET